MKAGHLSKKEFVNQCRTKSMKCKQTKTCFVHEGRHNLRKIRKWITTINREWIKKNGSPDLENRNHMGYDDRRFPRDITQLPAYKKRNDNNKKTKRKIQ